MWIESAIFLLIAAMGLSFGSLVTLLSYRLPRGMPVGAVRSRCPACTTPLGARDLFPLLSWMLHRGACRHCHTKISWRYPLTELVTMAAFIAIYLQLGISAEGIVLALLSVCLMVMIVTDLEHYMIPDPIQLVMAGLGLVYHLILLETNGLEVLGGLLTGLAIGAALQGGYRCLRKKEGLGTGDVKFLAVAGIWLGILNLVPFLFLSGILGIVLGLLWRLLGRGEAFPFGPALALSLWLHLLYPALPNLFWHPFPLYF